MRLLLFSDLHTDKDACRGIVEKSSDVDFVIGAGDYAIFRTGLDETLESLSGISVPTILVHGNHESHGELVAASARYENFHVLHGETIRLKGILFAGLGAGIPITPFGDWSVDLSEEEAQGLLPEVQEDFILVSHSPPFLCLDQMDDGQHIGSQSILSYIHKTNPSLVVCGHIHEQWSRCETIHDNPVINAGPQGVVFEFPSKSGCGHMY